MLLSKKLISRNIFSVKVKPLLHTMWKKDKVSLTEKKFRQINYLVISIVNQLLSRNFCEKSVGENFCNFRTVHMENRKLLYPMENIS